MFEIQVCEIEIKMRENVWDSYFLDICPILTNLYPTYAI